MLNLSERGLTDDRLNHLLAVAPEVRGPRGRTNPSKPGGEATLVSAQTDKKFLKAKPIKRCRLAIMVSFTKVVK